MRPHFSTDWIIRTVSILCAGASFCGLQAGGEARLRNDTGRWLGIHRVPSPHRAAHLHDPGTLLGRVAAAFEPTAMPARTFPKPEEILLVQPGATAVFHWEGTLPEAAQAHLGVRIGASQRRCFLTYQVPSGQAEGALGPYLESGPRACMDVQEDGGQLIHAFTGTKEETVESKAVMGDLDPELDPEAPRPPFPARPDPRITGVLDRNRRLAVSTMPPDDPTGAETPAPTGPAARTPAAHAPVFLVNHSGADVFLTFPRTDMADLGPDFVMQTLSNLASPRLGPWQRADLPAGRGARIRERIRPGELRAVALAQAA